MFIESIFSIKWESACWTESCTDLTTHTLACTMNAIENGPRLISWMNSSILCAYIDQLGDDFCSNECDFCCGSLIANQVSLRPVRSLGEVELPMHKMRFFFVLFEYNTRRNIYRSVHTLRFGRRLNKKMVSPPDEHSGTNCSLIRFWNYFNQNFVFLFFWMSFSLIFFFVLLCYLHNNSKLFS